MLHFGTVHFAFSGAVDRRGKPIEVVLDYIVERKRMDDLASSIVDGRFKEQKVNRSSLECRHFHHPRFLKTVVQRAAHFA